MLILLSEAPRKSRRHRMWWLPMWPNNLCSMSHGSGSSSVVVQGKRASPFPPPVTDVSFSRMPLTKRQNPLLNSSTEIFSGLQHTPKADWDSLPHQAFCFTRFPSGLDSLSKNILCSLLVGISLPAFYPFVYKLFSQVRVIQQLDWEVCKHWQL